MATVIFRVLLATIALIAVTECVRSANADHLQYLPLVPNTPLMQQVIQTQEYTYCLDNRTSSYPGFASQLEDVNQQYELRTGIKTRRVEFNDPACQVRHTMPSNINCDGWAGRIFYANWPVTVEYCYTLGYSDWRSTHGHELGHGLLGLHEQYRDSGGQLTCTGRTWTVMDCGGSPPVRYPQSIDVQRGCAIISTSWCGHAPEPVPEWGPCETYGDGSVGCWNNHGGYWQRTIWNPATYRWRPDDPTWRCVEACP